MRYGRLLFTMTALVVLTAFLSSAAAAAEPKRGGTLRVVYGNQIRHLDFHTAPGYEMMWVAMNVGCGLVNITPEGKFVGDVAKSWSLSPDGKTYTFKLRDNAVFHDGTKVDAAAVKFSIDRLKDPKTKSGMRRFYAPVHSVEVVDPLTVQVRLKHTYAFFLHMIAGYRTGLVLYSPTATKKYSLNDRKTGRPEAVAGCGPFKLVEWFQGSHLIMDRFDKYFVPGRPYLDRVHVRVIKDPVTQMAAFKAGEVDFIASFSPEHVDTIKLQSPKAQILTGPETTPMVAFLKVTVPKDGKPDPLMKKERLPHPVFGDIRVRKAVACYGMDREEIVKIAFKGQATPWAGMIPPGTPDTVNVNARCSYDPAKAKALLAEAGYGPSKPLTFDIVANTEKSVFNIIATVIKEQMTRIGVTANIKVVDKSTWLDLALRDGPWDMFIEDFLSLLSLDSNAYLSVVNSSWNAARHQDTKVDAYYAAYAKELDPAKRKAIARELQEYAVDKLYWNAVSGSPFFQIAQPWMKGYTYNAEFEVHYDTVWLDK
ncbi:MAG: ABC transporter substrate-binding protein [Candidatus Methylomirabilia bacterium]